MWMERQYDGKMVFSSVCYSCLFLVVPSEITKREGHWLVLSLWLQAFADSRSSFGLKKITKLKNIREITMENLQLEPLCDEVV